jgi:hypothetical protein
VLYAEGRLSADLDPYDTQQLRELISRSTADASVQMMDTDDDQRVEVSVE